MKVLPDRVAVFSTRPGSTRAGFVIVVLGRVHDHDIFTVSGFPLQGPEGQAALISIRFLCWCGY